MFIVHIVNSPRMQGHKVNDETDQVCSESNGQYLNSVRAGVIAISSMYTHR